jgi:hypothetical protein
MTEPSGNELGPITLNAGDVRGLRALLQIANDTSCAAATRELARLGLAGYLSTILGEPPVIEDGGACEQPDSSGGQLDRLDEGAG